MSKRDPYCARCRGSDCICDLIVEVRRLEIENRVTYEEKQRYLERDTSMSKEIESLREQLGRSFVTHELLADVDTLLHDLVAQLDDAPAGLRGTNDRLRERVRSLTKRLRPDPTRKSRLEPEENSGRPPLPSPNTAPRPVRSVFLFANGNSAVCGDDDQQIPELQGNWIQSVLRDLRRRGAQFAPEATVDIQGHRDGARWPVSEIGGIG